MKSNKVKINPNKVAKNIAERIRNGEYEQFKLTMNRLQEISKKLIANENLSSNDIITLRLNGYISPK